MSQKRYGRCVVRGATLRGVKAVPVDVEVSVNPGMPSFSIVGMPDAAIQEAKVRIRAACAASGFKIPAANIVVNLAPGSLRKTGSGFDLPIAIGLLCATQQIDPRLTRGYLWVGELSLEGNTRVSPGALAYALCARDEGLALVSPTTPEPALPVAGLKQWHVSSLESLKAGEMTAVSTVVSASSVARTDYSDVAGHDIPKRCLQIAAAGGHGLLMVGPPGSGKTMLASRLPSILPPLSEQEQLEAAVIHSVAGFSLQGILRGVRPFRAPHHSATLAGLVGGGSPLRPGEVTLAHHGVLFLDELAEYKPSVLQGIRQPIESGNVSLTRADGNIVFPACFTLVAATNPCPCGFYGDVERACHCTESQIRNYQGRIGGPILDRIDMQLEVGRLSTRSVLETGKGTTSAELRDGVMAARDFSAWRTERYPVKEGLGDGPRLLALCQMDEDAKRFLEAAATVQSLSGRGIIRVLSVARTIADLGESLQVTQDHLGESLSFRLTER